MESPDRDGLTLQLLRKAEEENVRLKARVAQAEKAATDEQLRLLNLLQKAEAARRMAEHRLEALLDSATNYVIVTSDLERRITSWSAGAERILGWTADEVLGRPFDVLFTADDQATGVPTSEAATALSEGRAKNERWHLRADGSRFFASGWTVPMRHPTEEMAEPEGFLIIMRDCTNEQRAEEALRESEARYRYTVELSPQIPFTADTRGNIVDFSSRWTRLTGMTCEQTRGWGWSRAVHPEDRRQVLKRWIHCLRTGEACDVGGRYRTADGGSRWFQSRVYPRHDGEGAVIAWHGTLEDVTDRKTAEQRLKALLELGDRLRDLRHSRELVLAASEIIGQALGAARVGYATINLKEQVDVHWDWTDGRVPSLVDAWDGPRPPVRPTVLHTLITSGEVVAVTDVTTDQRTEPARDFYEWMEVRAMLKVPVIVGGRAAAFIFVHDPQPRVWTTEEITFVRGAAERTWSAMERAAAETSQTLLTHELNHRVKNTLSMVQALALQTIRRSPDLASFGPVYQARLLALARAHDILTIREWRGAMLSDVVRSSLHNAGDGRIDLKGCPDGELLAPEQAVALALALHELSTNAIKHGALSRPEGTVSVICSVEDSGAVQRIDWIELGGPAIEEPPRRKGFGLRLLERGLAVQLNMLTTLDFAPTGLRCMLRFPRAAIRHPGPMPSTLRSSS